jgi:tripartite-type tricarboxylate transporter receptor subunit TctC
VHLPAVLRRVQSCAKIKFIKSRFASSLAGPGSSKSSFARHADLHRRLCMPFHPLRSLRAVSLALAASLGLSLQAPSAQAAYPDKPIKMVVGFTAGGTADTVGRIMAQAMGERLHQTIVVENRTGANGNLATESVARSAPDGYTIFFTSVGHAVNPYLYKSAKYDPIKDFTPIGQVLSAPNVLVVPPSSPFKTLEELIAFARANPGKLNVASSGFGSSVHLSAELFMQATGVKLTHIPYKGTSVALPDLMSGTISMMFPNLPSLIPMIESGKLRALGVTTAKRSSAAPNIPTIAEAGVPGYDMSTWYGFVGPANMDAAIVKQLNTVVQQTLADPAIRKKLSDQGVDIVSGSAEDFGRMIQAESDKWKRLIKDANIQIQ